MIPLQEHVKLLMKISFNWLKQFIDIPYSPAVLADALTSAGLEVEHLEQWCNIKGGLKGIVVGKVLKCDRHPNADRLHITSVDTGESNPRQIVCGAPNVAAGQTVIVALPGAVLYPSKGEPFEIKNSKIRGEVSEGMICAEDEIGIGESHAGIMVIETMLSPGTPASEYFKIENDWIFEIGLTPNRADAASHLGVARDIRAILGNALLSMPDISAFKEGDKDGDIRVRVDSSEGCIRYSGIELKNIKVGLSPEWLQIRLRSIGLRPINNVVDVTNYVMHELGQPLHAFDASKIRGGAIHVGNCKQGELFSTLDDFQIKLSGHELMICDDGGGICMAGVYGGKDSGVNETTNHVFLESATFHPVHVRKSARHHGLHTDSSFRFERGTDPNMPLFALKRAALMLQEIAGAEIHGKLTDIYPSPVQNKRIPFSMTYLKSLVGHEIPSETVHRILADLGIESEVRADEMILSIPPFKVDVIRPADVVEEVLRIYGYNNIPLPSKIAITPGSVTNPDPERLIEKSASILASLGFREIITNSLTRLSHLETLPLGEGSDAVTILNPLSGELALMRHSLLTTGLEVLAYNINRRQKDLRLFEFGKSYHRSAGRYHEQDHLCIWCTGDLNAEHWNNKSRQPDIYFIKGVVENLLSSVAPGVKGKLTVSGSDETGCEWSVTYSHKKSAIARVSQVSKSLLKVADIGQPVWYAEIQMQSLLRLADTIVKDVDGPPRFPEVRRDLSMLLDRSVDYSSVERLAYQTESRLLKHVNLFDVYEGDKIESGKKSYALSFILRDDEATLQEKQIESVMEKLMKQFEGKLGAVIRKA